MINEERMSVYVRLGIRLLYKGLKSRRMEKDKSKSCQSTYQTTSAWDLSPTLASLSNSRTSR